ncbi:uncharacterized protein LOC131675911 [Topomyia yanbarensis]|uniref:uncharacterized protein LOC131675911 n=1 Tax=Topomyia yanbarensis TaxID=2498891 RepID=UPI00273ADE01|nr:uncharacterized protein LOC131675911 [Topomyia yanbarensis]
MTQLADGTEVVIKPHPTLNMCRCVISSFDLLEVDDEEIKENLENQGVIEIRRIKKRVNEQPVTTSTIILTFGKTTYPVTRVATRPYYPTPMLCYSCFRYGHPRTRCPGPARCSKCSGIHTEDQCTNQSYCINCKEDHRPSDRQFPKFQKEMEIIRIKIEHNLSFPEARKRMEGSSRSYAQVTSQKKTPILGIKIETINATSSRKTTDDRITELLEEMNKKIQEIAKLEQLVNKLKTYIKENLAGSSSKRPTNQTATTPKTPITPVKPTNQTIPTTNSKRPRTDTESKTVETESFSGQTILPANTKHKPNNQTPKATDVEIERMDTMCETSNIPIDISDD